MQTEPESLFELLEPPPGGVERMRARFAEPWRARRGVVFAASGIAGLAALVALLAILSSEMGGRTTADNALLAAPELDRLLGRESRPVPLTVERDGQAVQTEELPSSDARIRIYRVL
jgi:Mrp family chromosome partitioning ATPase